LMRRIFCFGKLIFGNKMNSEKSDKDENVVMLKLLYKIKIRFF
jgi:hypothetical protein